MDLHTVDFPIFFIQAISERHIVIAGGGGSSKTGVHNQINVIELVPTMNSWKADPVMKYQTPTEIPDAPMSGALFRDIPIHETRLVCGGMHATIYNFEFDPNKLTFIVSGYESLKDSKTRAEIKTVKYFPGHVLTGGIDGQLTCWNVHGPNMLVEKDIKAHKKEIDDIDVDSANQHMVTLSRGESCFIIWNLGTFERVDEVSSKSIDKLAPNISSSAGYIFRSCRFADSYILVACNPTTTKNHSSKIFKRRITKDQNDKYVYCEHASVADSITAMTVSLDAKYVGVGTRSGGVEVYEVNNMKNIYRVDNAHHNAVTSLEFLPPKQESLTLTNSRSCPLMSTSIDRRVVLHRPKTQSFTARIMKTITLVLVIYLVFLLFNRYYDVKSYISLD